MNKYELINLDKTQVIVDISMLESGDIYINATEVAKQFAKQPSSFLRLKSTYQYINEILAESHYVNSHTENLVRVVNGGKYKGTWLHKELAYEFAGWCSASFRRKLHKWIDQRIVDEQARKLQRQELKTGFLPLTNAILADHLEPKHYHFSNECDLINKLVTGKTAKQFKSIHGVDHVRDGLTVNEIELMGKLQRQNTSLIELGFSYEERKTRLQLYVTKTATTEATGLLHG